MRQRIEISDSVPQDSAAIELLYPAAFPDENLLPLVRDLLQDSAIGISLVATIDSQIVGHVIFTRCGITGSSVNVSLLGPLAVLPDRQRQGIGSAIVRAGLQRLEDAGVRLVCVLGDPAYYGRLGFVPESSVKPPYDLPAEWEGAWQSQNLGNTRAPDVGTLSVPRQWRQPELWAT